MQRPPCVHGGQRRRELSCDAQRGGGRDAFDAGDARCERLIDEAFHHDEHIAAGGQPPLIDLHHVRVVEREAEFRLLHGPGHALADVARGVADDLDRIEGRIGAGGFGMVYRATQSGVGRTVAVKLFAREPAQDAAVLRRFFLEVRAGSRLTSPHTVRLIEYGESAGHVFYAMEHLVGDTLATTIAAGPLAVPRAARVLDQMCLALQEAHELGIVHRDIKPDADGPHRRELGSASPTSSSPASGAGAASCAATSARRRVDGLGPREQTGQR